LNRLLSDQDAVTAAINNNDLGGLSSALTTTSGDLARLVQDLDQAGSAIDIITLRGDLGAASSDAQALSNDVASGAPNTSSDASVLTSAFGAATKDENQLSADCHF
jgi:hypothetical protein